MLGELHVASSMTLNLQNPKLFTDFCGCLFNGKSPGNTLLEAYNVIKKNIPLYHFLAGSCFDFCGVSSSGYRTIRNNYETDYDTDDNKKEANSLSLNYILDQIIDLFARKCALFPSALVHF
jgi:hypothetical protein